MIKIYSLSDPRDPENIRYIGQTSKELKNRLSVHLSPKSLISKTHKNNWLNLLLEQNIKPIIKLVEEVDVQNWSVREIFWIEYFKNSGYNLTNSTDGGEGMLNPSEETRKKLSIASSGKNNPNYGRKRTEEINNKINDVRVIKHTDETKKIISDFGKGRRHSDQTKKKISDANKNKTVSEETRKKISDANKNKVVSEETKEKLSIVCSGEKNGFYGKKHNLDSKSKISESKKGKKLSNETKEKMSNSQKGEKNGFYGKKHSEETKRKMSETRQRKKEEKLKEILTEHNGENKKELI